MADYILDVKSQTNKLDWTMPFQRTGAFPLDRSALFSSLEDAKKYARGDGSDERALGGTSYIGQIISVLESEEVSAYVITKSRGLMKLAATTATGDLSQDIVDLQGKLDTLATSVEANETAIKALDTRVKAAETTVAGIDDKIKEGVANADHLTRAIVESLDDIKLEKDDGNTIYMVKSGDKYDEYMVVDGALEKLGDWDVDLSGYYTSAQVDEKFATKEDLEGLDSNFVKSVTEDFAVSEVGQLSLNDLPQSKITGLEAVVKSFEKFMTDQADTDAAQNEKLTQAATAISEINTTLEALNNTYVSETEFSTRVGNLTSLLQAVGKESTTIVDEIIELREMLAWGSLDE